MSLKHTLVGMPEQVKLLGDVGAGSISLAAILGWIPHLAAIGSLIWVCLRIYNEILDIQAKRKKR